MKRIFPVLIFISLLYLGNSALASSQSSYIRGWLVCGPFEGSDLETECFKNEAQVTPKEGEVSGGKEWKMYSSSEDMVDFEDKELFGAYDFSDGYAYIEVKSPQRKEVRLLLGSDDGIKVWLNGRNILTNDIPRGFGIDADKLNVILEPGWNRLLLKVNDIGGQWCFSARFSDYQNSLVGDLEYRPKVLKMTPVEVKEATASSVEGGKATLSAAKAVDGDLATRWSSEGKDPQWICLDLGAPVEINRVVLSWETACAQSYKIEISDDKESWTEIYSTNSNEGGKNTITLKEPKTARYVRLYCIKRANENWGNSLWEFQVFSPETESPTGGLESRPQASKPTPAPAPVKEAVVSLKGAQLPVKEATASSVEAGKPEFSAANVIDGDPATRWSSVGKDPQWVCLDLGAPANITKVVLNWETACAQEYKIEVSNDKKAWTEVYSTDSNEGGENTITLKEPKTARYVRVYCIKRANEAWGNSLWEFQVYGK